MNLKSISFLGLITVSASLYSCTNSVKGTATSEPTFEVIESFKTPIVRGAGSLKGMRIGLSYLVSDFDIDSIKYEGIITTPSILKASNDTVWVEAFFYPNQFLVDGSENTNEFSSNQCTIFSHHQSKKNQLVISNLKLVTDLTMWK